MAITKTTPAGSRATRLTQDTVADGAVATKWDIVPEFDSSFIITTTVKGATSEGILGADLGFVDLWLPPLQSYTVRTRHVFKNGDTTEWTDRISFASRGPLNSFEKYQALNGTSGVDNVVV